ncbi:MAG: OmpH family outer membrane protein [Gammaproteobacteria bacterium]|nr:OmpH family outer membrane protein [Gammaproteobacteria bacterium]
MKKVFVFLSSILLVAASSAYAADAAVPASKVAVVNVQQVLLQSPKVAKVNTKLQDQFKPRQEKLSAQQKTLQDEVDKFNKESATMTPKDRDAMDKKLADEKASFLKDAGAFQKQVSEEQNKAMQSILGELNKIISDMAKQNGYSLVLDSQAVVYASDATDITKLVAKDFNK